MLARHVQNIIMYLLAQQYQHIVDHNLLPNCPVQWANIAAAEHIYGTNVAALKGKTISWPGSPTVPQCNPVLSSVISLHPSVILSIDIMYVNGIMFLVTTSRTIHFGTIESIPNCHVPTLVKALGHVLGLYHWRGFQIAMVYADPEF